MSRLQCIAIAALLLACPLYGQELPSAPSSARARIVDKKFVLIESVAVAANLFDLETTRRGLASGRLETSPLYGPHPSTPRLYAEGLGIEAALVLADYGFKKWLGGHPAWMILPVLRMVGHGMAGAANR